MAIQAAERKLAELILYISQKYSNDANFGQIKLNKALFFPDFTAYANWGRTITGADYQHLKEGPTVYRMVPVLETLIAERALAIEIVDCYGYQQKRPVSLRQADLSLFTGPEIALVDAWLERLRPMNGKEVSDLSHKTAGWNMTSDRENIKPSSVFIGWNEPTAAEIKRGQELAARYGLLA